MQQDSEILRVNDEEKLQAHKNNVCSITGNVNFRTNKDTIKWIISNQGDTSQQTLYLSAKEYFGCIKSTRKETVSKQLLEYGENHKQILQNIKYKVMKENNGNWKKYSNPPTNFKPREQYKFLKERGNNKFSCKKCNFHFNDEDEVSKHIIETHEQIMKDAVIKECSEMVTKHGQRSEVTLLR